MRYLFLFFIAGIFSACAKGGSDPSIFDSYPSLKVISPAGVYSFTDKKITCSATCHLEFDAAANFISQFAIVCSGNLTISSSQLDCTGGLTMTKN